MDAMHTRMHTRTHAHTYVQTHAHEHARMHWVDDAVRERPVDVQTAML